MQVGNQINYSYITRYQQLNIRLCSYVGRNKDFEERKDIDFSKNHNIQENIFYFRENHVNLWQIL